jgi:hypothetical protein
MSRIMTPSIESRSYSQRRDSFLRFMVHQARSCPTFPDVRKQSWCSAYNELPKLELARRGESVPPLDESLLLAALDHMAARRDCGDFLANAIIRIVYQYFDSPLLSDSLRLRIEEVLLGWMYWVDEPGEERCCFLSENHQILYHTAELLAGQRYPNRIFTNINRLGIFHRDLARAKIHRWLNWRLRFGFSEWNSNYYDEDFAALANLLDFAHDPEIRSKARSLIDILLLQMAQHSHKGVFGSSTGRIYETSILKPDATVLAAVQWLCWGRSSYQNNLSMSAINLALSRYEPPAMLAAIALDEPAEAEFREHHGVDVEEAARLGLRVDSLSDFPLFASMAQHRAVVETARTYVPRKHGNADWGIQYALEYYRGCEQRGESFDPDTNPTALSAVNLYTFRTPEFMLSCAQDYRKGKPGYQQHIWQATLSDRALVFTTAPSPERTSRPGHWAGNALNPRAVAHRNVLLSVYRIIPRPQLGMQPLPHRFATHAYFPKWAFDETIEMNGWYFARKGDGYIALRSLAATQWIEPEKAILELNHKPGQALPESSYEILAEGAENVWICELGNPHLHGRYVDFVDAISRATVSGDTSHIVYQSPSLGEVTFGWDRELRVAGQAVKIADYPRCDSPYVQSQRGSGTYQVSLGQERWNIPAPAGS